jgi:hypothetical protein
MVAKYHNRIIVCVVFLFRCRIKEQMSILNGFVGAGVYINEFSQWGIHTTGPNYEIAQDYICDSICL